MESFTGLPLDRDLFFSISYLKMKCFKLRKVSFDRVIFRSMVSTKRKKKNEKKMKNS